jgi:hypothetical protein
MNPNIKDALAAAWRKAVAGAVGGALAWVLRRYNIVLSEESTQAFVMSTVVVMAALYGALVNFLEIKIPKLGWFLGLARQPKFLKVTPPGEPNRTLDGAAV